MIYHFCTNTLNYHTLNAIVIIITADMHKFMNTKGIDSIITEQP